MLLDRFVPTDGTAMVILAPWNPEDEAAPGGITTRYLKLPGGGVFDLRGSAQILPGERSATHTGLILEQSAAAFQTSMDAHRSLNGKRGRVYALTEDGQPRWAHGRAIVAPSARTPQDMYRFVGYWTQEVETRFDLLSPVWYGIRHGAVEAFTTGLDLGSGDTLGDTADQVTLDTTPKTFAMLSNGNAPVLNAIVTVTAVSTPLTSLRVQAGLADWTWTGSVAVGQSLVIDTGALTIRNNGVAAYSGLTFNVGHAQAEWLLLAPGANSITITRVGGANSTIRFDYYDAWM